MTKWLYEVTVRSKAGDERTLEFFGESADSVRAALAGSKFSQDWSIVLVQEARGEMSAPISAEQMALERLLSIDDRLKSLENRRYVTKTTLALSVCAGLWLYAVSILVFWVAVILLMGGSIWGIGRSISP